MGIKEKWRRFRPVLEDTEERLSALKELFVDKHVELCCLFGSRAQRGQGEDIDIAVLGCSDIEALLTALYEALDTERLDLVDLDRAPVTLQFEVIGTGKVLYKKSDEVENAFELKVLKTYQDWAPVRRRHIEVLAERTESWLSRSR